VGAILYNWIDGTLTCPHLPPDIFKR
jgi:hypothetical protein